MNINSQDEDENSLVGQLKIESTILKKTFVGGLRNSKTGKEFHHAFTQSEQSYCFQKYKIQLEKSSIHLNTRGVQTQILINKSAQSKREYGIQMEKTDLKISEEDDRFVSVGNYQNSDDYLKFSSTSAIMIQRLWRGAIARIWVKDYRELIEKEKIREAME